jgi:hypothetical protein
MQYAIGDELKVNVVPLTLQLMEICMQSVPCEQE